MGGDRFGGMYDERRLHQARVTDLYDARSLRQVPMALGVQAAGICAITVAALFMPVAVFAGSASGELTYSELASDFEEASGLTAFVHSGATQWIGLAIALGCIGFCALRISDDAGGRISTGAGLIGSGYLAVAALLVWEEVRDIASDAGPGVSVDTGLGVWVAILGAVVTGIGCMIGYIRRPRELPDPEDPGFAPAPPPP